MEQPKLMDIRPDRSLLNPNFDGYKLALAPPITTISSELQVPPYRIILDNNFSLLYIKLYGFYNHLIGDDECVYYVDESWNINKYWIESEVFMKKIVWQIPVKSEGNESQSFYNASLKFVSEQVAVASEGAGFLYILDRTTDDWKEMYCEEVIGPEQNFIVSDAVCMENEVNVLLLSIVQKPNSEHNISRLHWVTLIKTGDNHWKKQGPAREFTVDGHVQYVAFEKNCKAFYVASNGGCKFVSNVESETVKEGQNIPEKERPCLGEEVTEGQEQNQNPMGITYNSEQVEECDFEGNNELTIFERICCNTHEITHKANLGSHEVEITVNLEKDSVPALGVQFDVDVCIWQPEMNPDFNLEHKGTLMALGYVKASKTQRKFVACSPDLSYSCICEPNRHLFIYLQKKYVSSGELRNRITGRRVNAIAQQRLVSLPENSDIIGIYASNSYIYILGEAFIKAFKV